MEKVKLPIRIKIAAVVSIIMGIIFVFLNPVFPDSVCSYYSFLLFILGFSYFFFPTLLLRRVKWAWYGATVSIAGALLISIIFFIKSINGNFNIISILIYISILISPQLILLKLLLLDRKKYLEVSSLESFSKRKKINILIIAGLLIVFAIAIVSAFIKESICWF